MTETIDFSKDRRYFAIVANVERLVSDAHLLLERGSAGTALATAILAFEEAGKGERLSLGWTKPRGRGSPSWHVFRQQVAAFSLFASLFQKYGLSLPKLDADIERHFEERCAGDKSFDELLQEPIPEAILLWFLGHRIPGYDHLSEEERLVLGIELRWVRKVFVASATGKTEVERQGGLYVDVEENEVTSDPAETKKIRAAYWISVAERALDIQRDGVFGKPYGQLATYLETLPKPLPSLEDLDEQIQQLKGDENRFNG